MTRYKKHSNILRENKRIAQERISILFTMAIEIFGKDQRLAQPYVELARTIGMRYKVRLPINFRRMVCRHCKGFILAGKNCIVRIRGERETHVVITCLKCGKHNRIPVKNKKSKRWVPIGVK